jgi:SIR2-like protein
MDSDQHIVYFLGAGATLADYPEAPLMAQLLHCILRSRDQDDFLVEFLGHVFDSEAVHPLSTPEERPRVDDVFTVVDTCLSGKAPFPQEKNRDDFLEARSQIIAGIGQVISEAVREGKGRLAEKLARRSVTARSTTIISTNYDIVMDNALLALKNVNYGIPVRSAVHQHGPVPTGREDEVRHFKEFQGSQLLIRQGNVSLLKLHGSLNWLYCPRCDELDVTLETKGGALVLQKPHLGRCCRETCTARYEVVLVGPSLEQRYEHPVLAKIWSRSDNALREATDLVIIGYSLPEADYLIRAMLARNFSRRSHRVTLISKPNGANERETLRRRFSQLFPRCRFHWGGLEQLISGKIRIGWRSPTRRLPLPRRR